MEDLEEVEVVGQGSYGRCILCRNVNTDDMVVVKKINLIDLPDDARHGVVDEVRLLSHCNHPHIIGYKDTFIHGDSFNIVMEYANGGDLSSIIREAQRYGHGGHFPEAIVIDMFVQICLAIKHVHANQILHRDIKTKNIFILNHVTSADAVDMIVSTKEGIKSSSRLRLVLGDFGSGKLLNSNSEMAKTLIGTPYNMSPEICEGSAYGKKSDIWSLGCVLYELLTLRHAFDGQTLPALVLRICRGRYPSVSKQYSPELRSLLKSMLETDPRNRPTAAQILRLPFIQSYRDTAMLSAGLCSSPSSSPSLTDEASIALVNYRKRNIGSTTEMKVAMAKEETVVISDSLIILDSEKSTIDRPFKKKIVKKIAQKGSTEQKDSVTTTTSRDCVSRDDTTERDATFHGDRTGNHDLLDCTVTIEEGYINQPAVTDTVPLPPITTSRDKRQCYSSLRDGKNNRKAKAKPRASAFVSEITSTHSRQPLTLDQKRLKYLRQREEQQKLEHLTRKCNLEAHAKHYKQAIKCTKARVNLLDIRNAASQRQQQENGSSNDVIFTINSKKSSSETTNASADSENHRNSASVSEINDKHRRKKIEMKRERRQRKSISPPIEFLLTKETYNSLQKLEHTSNDNNFKVVAPITQETACRIYDQSNTNGNLSSSTFLDLQERRSILRELCISQMGQNRFHAIYEFLRDSQKSDLDEAIGFNSGISLEKQLSELLGINAIRFRDAVRKVGQLLVVEDRIADV